MGQVGPSVACVAKESSQKNTGLALARHYTTTLGCAGEAMQLDNGPISLAVAIVVAQEQLLRCCAIVFLPALFRWELQASHPRVAWRPASLELDLSNVVTFAQLGVEVTLQLSRAIDV